MLLAVLTRTLASMARTWQRVLLVNLALALLVAVVGGFVALVVYGYGASPAIVVLAAVAGLLVANWSALASIRVASGGARLLEALGGTVPGAARLIVADVVFGVVLLATWVVAAAAGGRSLGPVGVLLGTLLLAIPAFAAVASVAREPKSWGMSAAWRLGVQRMHRNVGAYVAIVLVLLVVGALALVLLLAPVVLLAGAPTSADTATTSAVLDYAGETAAGFVIGGFLAGIAILSMVPSLAWAVYSTVADVDDVDAWGDENLEPVRVEREMSPVIEALVGAGVAPGTRRRMQVPPRAAQPGRLPGPGEMSVTGVTLPAGATVREVDSPTLELDLSDAAPTSSTQVASSTATLWLSGDPLADPAPTWKRLAAGFAESGLWPVLVREEQETPSGPWFEQRARRERDMLDATAVELFASRLSESLAADTPLASVDLLRGSAITSGELRRGSGRRGDAVDATLRQFGGARLGLVPARMPAEVVHRLAWPGATIAEITGVELAAMLASWEERWGALLVGIDSHTLTFAVLKPPTSLDEAVEAAAEHHALYPDQVADHADDRAYAEALVDAVTWSLTWS